MNALTCNRLFGRARRPDTHLLTLPLFHSFGSTVQMNAGFSMAATLVLLPRFDAAAGGGADAEGGHHLLRRRPDDVVGAARRAIDDGSTSKRIAGNLRIGVSGGSSLPVEIIKEVKEQARRADPRGLRALGDLAGGDVLRPRPGGRVPGSIGVPIWGVELKLIADELDEIEGADEIGEIAIRGHNIMKGYSTGPRRPPR